LTENVARNSDAENGNLEADLEVDVVAAVAAVGVSQRVMRQLGIASSRRPSQFRALV
jgi:hypothetical protein